MADSQGLCIGGSCAHCRVTYGINHTAMKKQHEAVAAVDYGALKAVSTPVVVRVTDVGRDIGCQGRAAEEYGRTIVLALVLILSHARKMPWSESGRRSARRRRWSSMAARHALHAQRDAASWRGERRRNTSRSRSKGSSLVRDMSTGSMGGQDRSYRCWDCRWIDDQRHPDPCYIYMDPRVDSEFD
jgi:hypothetical protein